jgi:outer membrane lipoprotein
MEKHINITIWHLVFGLIFILNGLFYLTGCAPVISRQLRKHIAKELTLSAVLKDPDICKGKTVLWCGVIISSVNLKEGTMIEVLQKPADRQGKTKDVDESEGRFLAL